MVASAGAVRLLLRYFPSLRTLDPWLMGAISFRRQLGVRDICTPPSLGVDQTIRRTSCSRAAFPANGLAAVDGKCGALMDRVIGGEPYVVHPPRRWASNDSSSCVSSKV